MAEFAAVCDSCRKPFPSGIELGPGSTNITFGRMVVGPCPWCRYPQGTVEPGTFDVAADDVIRLSNALPASREDLQKLSQVLTEILAASELSKAEMAARIENAVPDSGRLVAILKESVTFERVMSLIQTVATLLLLLGIHA